MQLVTASPFMMTVQQPHAPSSQATFVPVSSRRSRSVCASVSCGGTWPWAVPMGSSYSLPLTRRVMMRSTRFFIVYLLFRNCEALVYCMDSAADFLLVNIMTIEATTSSALYMYQTPM